jgi:hypothetical protein
MDAQAFFVDFFFLKLINKLTFFFHNRCKDKLTENSMSHAVMRICGYGDGPIV